ncbi:MAG: glycosyltransferase family 39 protein [Candidatus Omnitrophica bacterium]|nr:glycosyltransferase family 39 protein [Candidatus Omnitrophota bacterium]
MNSSIPSEMAVSKRAHTAWAVGSLVLLSLVLNIWNLDFGLPYRYHADEVLVIDSAFWTVGNGMRPDNYYYGAFHLYTLILLDGLFFVVGLATGLFQNIAEFKELFYTYRDPFVLIGRLASVLYGTGIVITSWLMARILLKHKGWAYLVGFLAAISPIVVEHSHYGIVDIPMTFWISVSLIFAMRAYETGKIRDYLFCAVCAGVATSTKYTAILLGVAPVISFLLSRKRPPILHFILTLAALPLTFLLTSPFLILDFKNAVSAILWNRRQVVDIGNFGINPEGSGYVDGLKYLSMGVGIPSLLLGLLGTVLFVMKQNKRIFPLLGFSALHVSVIGGWKNSYARYWLPLVPICLVAAVAVLQDCDKWVGSRLKMTTRFFLIAFCVLVLAISPIKGVMSFQRELVLPDTRTMACEWIYENIPAGSHFITEPAWCMPQLSSKWFKVTRIHGFGIGKLQNYAALKSYGADFVITSSDQRKNFEAEPGRFPGASIYSQLDESAELLKVVKEGPNRQGSTIYIYALPIIASTHPPEQTQPQSPEKNMP